MVGLIITETASRVPKNVVSNGELWSEQDLHKDKGNPATIHKPWDLETQAMINERTAENTGIRERRFASADETASALAASVAEELGGGICDHLVVASALGDDEDLLYASDNFGDVVAQKIGYHGPTTLYPACSGFVSALEYLDRTLQPGEEGVVVAADTPSRFLDIIHDKRAQIFGDAGAGVRVLKTEEAGLLAYEEASFEVADASLFYMRSSFNPEYMPGRRFFSIHSANIRRGAISLAEILAEKLDLEKLGLGLDDISKVIAHQSGERFLRDLVLPVGIDDSRFEEMVPLTSDIYANTLAASGALTLDKTLRGEVQGPDGHPHLINPGDYIFLLTVGPGRHRTKPNVTEMKANIAAYQVPGQ